MKSTIAALLFVGVLVASSVSVAHACPNLASYVFGTPTQSTNAYLFPFALEQEPEFYAGAATSNASFTVFLPNDDAWNEVFTFFNTSKEEFALSPNLHLVFSYHTTLPALTLSEFPFGVPVTTGNPNNDTWTPRLVVIGDSVFGDIVPINLVPGSEVKVLEKDILCGDTRINIISKVMGPSFPATPAEEPIEECSTIADVVFSTPELASIAEAFDYFGETEFYDDPSLSLTLFAPTVSALDLRFADLGIPADVRFRAIPNDRFDAIFGHHQIAEPLTVDELLEGDYESLQTGDFDPSLDFELIGDILIVDGGVTKVVVTGPAYEACGSLIYPVNYVLIPEGTIPDILDIEAPASD